PFPDEATLTLPFRLMVDGWRLLVLVAFGRRSCLPPFMERRRLNRFSVGLVVRVPSPGFFRSPVFLGRLWGGVFIQRLLISGALVHRLRTRDISIRRGSA